ncbi:MAG TPA: DUF4266 domain-containing protein [Burkholderiaceae bacterium]|nr:DUF4266 domain-containing protein [Burkholderiaceae bacterium]
MTRPLLVLALVSALAGCASLPRVEPWQKGDLARPEMAFDAGSLDARNAASVYGSREAAPGGLGVGGGGCGCN